MKESCSIMGFEKLLLATDGSESVQAAIQEAINIAKVCSSKLFVISVVEVNPEYEALAPRVVEKAENETREHLDSVRARAEKEGIPCETVAHQGEEPFQFIVDEAKKKKVDMIIMGSHGRTGLKRLMMGSVTARVIGHAPCKVLVVPC
jgi:nucleotide-binding universal stress UspA family protein